VLILEPGKWHDEIRSTLKAVSLDDGSDYQTLSYVWGDPTETVKYEFLFCFAGLYFSPTTRISRKTGFVLVYILN
jgi:hypothetical protein